MTLTLEDVIECGTLEEAEAAALRVAQEFDWDCASWRLLKDRDGYEKERIKARRAYERHVAPYEEGELCSAVTQAFRIYRRVTALAFVRAVFKERGT
ncbi:MAG: hypothetical protein L0177_02965 [Chloroflexi bacterium]|nr:hypothetical protein [Chloroflexota bacterium]